MSMLAGGSRVFTGQKGKFRTTGASGKLTPPTGTTVGTTVGSVTDTETMGTTVGQPVTSTGSGVEQSMTQSPYAKFLAGLAKPIGYEDQSQQRWNLAREREQGITKLQMEQGSTAMG